MELTPLICPRCGAVLEAKEGENEYRCQYCGVTVVRDAGGALKAENDGKAADGCRAENEAQPSVLSSEKNAAELKSSSVENDEKAADGAGEKSKTAPGGFVSGKTPVPVPEVTLPGYILQCVKWALLPAFALSLLMSVLAGAEYIFAGTLTFLPGFLLIAALVFFFRNLKSYKERRRAYEEYKKARRTCEEYTAQTGRDT